MGWGVYGGSARRRLLCPRCRGGQLQRVHHVLNETLVDRGASPAMVVLECFVDGRHLTTVQVRALCLCVSLTMRACGCCAVSASAV